MHEQFEAGQEHELRWLVKRLGAGDPNGSIEELRQRAESALQAVMAERDRLKDALGNIGFIVTTHLGLR